MPLDPIGSSIALDHIQHIRYQLMRQNPSESEKLESFDRFREEMAKDVDEGVDDHESKMTKMGFMFLGIFVGVIALAAFLP